MTERLPPRESFTVRFKSDLKKFSDRDRIQALICLANTEDGKLWLGVEDDGTPKCMSMLPYDRSTDTAQ